MPVNPDQEPQLTPTRLAFRASPQLEARLVDFLSPQAQQILRERNKRIKLISRRVKNLDLGGVDGVGSHTKRFRKYERGIKDRAVDRTFQLHKDVYKDETVEDGLELSFALNFANKPERRLLVDLPFMYPEGRGTLEIYAALPDKALGDPRAIARAYELLELSMHEPSADGVPEVSHAPWQMNVRDVKIEHIVDQPSDEQQ